MTQPTEVVAARVRELRGELSAQQLADRVTEWTGVEMTRDAIANLENGRRTRISIEEVFALAYALGCSPLHLVLPGDVEELVHPFPKAMQVRQADTAGQGVRAWGARAWIRGDEPLPEVIPSYRERTPGFHEHDLAPDRWDAAEHPAVRALARVTSAVIDALTQDDPFVVDYWDELTRDLQFAKRHLDLLREEHEMRLARLRSES